MTETVVQSMQTWRIEVRGVVQGVGFRPFVHRLATRIGLRGHVRNAGGQVTITVTGTRADLEAFDDALGRARAIHGVAPAAVAHDAHPAYLSTQLAGGWPAADRITVQHHHAHVAGVAAEHGLTGPFLGIAYDGLGLGDDGTFWGGEVLRATYTGWPASAGPVRGQPLRGRGRDETRAGGDRLSRRRPARLAHPPRRRNVGL
ncbi:hypothetical protein Plo01_65080 [Planobispora longispora]|uniref:acylphosphatase n=1 Tax=Planobispora longispora TaxID=28887 RepID=A0A8J3RV25_9ACTN|nr:acylphosphatase [Planobispora longispora]BFE79286.1 hypothetical protein GCM10020093_018870 [Planobispora longispora]GIH80079.1 hypothetical protein Plo01_65080 [Planobispora longispora]